ncbi:hypothetical protein [Thermococcus sp.]|uniref:hypothetical protein n=1 Tax=Thermococcus sp. TaxID=35749 RepID=UPI00261EAC10|nr:hypothetical protein [Thermococcus sp.]
MPVVLQRTGGKSLSDALKEMTFASKIMLLEELMAIYSEWLGMVSEVLVGSEGLQKELSPYDVEARYRLMKTMEKLYATSDVYKALDDLVRTLTQE